MIKKRKNRKLKSCPLADIQLELIERSAVRATAPVKNSPSEKKLWCFCIACTAQCSLVRAKYKGPILKAISESAMWEMNRVHFYKLPASLWLPPTNEFTDVYQSIIFRKNKQGQISLEILTALRNWHNQIPGCTKPFPWCNFDQCPSSCKLLMISVAPLVQEIGINMCTYIEWCTCLH